MTKPIKVQTNKKSFLGLQRFAEYTKYSQVIQLVTIFPYQNILGKGVVFHAILNFSFKEIQFNKKRVLPFFLAIELLTNQKCVATTSTKDIFAWKLRRGMLSGCKVTLRNQNLFEFFDSLLLALPRMEKWKPLDRQKLQKNTNLFIALKLGELVLFYPLELGLNINAEIRKIDINLFFNTYTKEEKLYLLGANKIPVIKSH